jgi:hypothetical protein
MSNPKSYIKADNRTLRLTARAIELSKPCSETRCTLANAIREQYEATHVKVSQDVITWRERLNNGQVRVYRALTKDNPTAASLARANDTIENLALSADSLLDISGLTFREFTPQTRTPEELELERNRREELAELRAKGLAAPPRTRTPKPKRRWADNV